MSFLDLTDFIEIFSKCKEAYSSTFIWFRAWQSKL